MVLKKSNKNYIITKLFVLTALCVFAVGCGTEEVKTDEVKPAAPIESVQESSSQAEESSEETVTEESEEWGVPYYSNSFSVLGKTNVSAKYDVSYPSLHPSSKGRFAYQKDAALCMVSECDAMLDAYASVDSLESFLDVELNTWMISAMQRYRSGWSKDEDYQFTVTTKEPCTVESKGGPLNALKVTGTHHWREKHLGNEPSPEYDENWAGYVIDLGTEDYAYIMITVVDDSIMTKEGLDNMKLQPGQIEEYALKMAQSVCPYVIE